MSLEFYPFLRFISKTAYFIDDEVIAKDCRMLYVLSGEGSIDCEGREYRLQSDDLIYVPYNMWYHVTSTKDMFFYTINFDFSKEYSGVSVMRPRRRSEPICGKVFDTIPLGVQDVFSSEIYINGASFCEYHMNEMYMESLHLSEGYAQLQEAHLKILLMKVYRFLKKSQKTNLLCQKVIEEIKNNPKVNIRSIAKNLNYHPYYLNAVFKANENLSLHQYLMLRRLMHSKELLLTTKMSLEDIADTCGFSSQSHFSTAFKRQYGISPSSFRKLVY